MPSTDSSLPEREVLWEGRRRIVDREPPTNREENPEDEDEDEDSSDSEEQEEQEEQEVRDEEEQVAANPDAEEGRQEPPETRAEEEEPDQGTPEEAAPFRARTRGQLKRLLKIPDVVESRGGRTGPGCTG